MTADAGPGPPPARADPYVAYTRRFFRRWAPAYDLFALPMAPVYRAAAAAAAPRPGARVLDLCAGTGEVARRCARRGAHVLALDITPAMVLRGRAKTGRGVHWVLGDARRPPLPPGCLDAIVLSFALHDMPRRVRLEVLAAAARLTPARLVVLDYRLPPHPAARALAAALVGSFETAYFPGYGREGLAPLLAELGLPAPRLLRRGPGPVALHLVELAGDRKG